MVTALNTILRQGLFCTVNGIPTTAYEADAQHGVDRPIGTGSITIPGPMPAHIDLNVPIEVQGGYRDGIIRTLFSGRVTDTQEELTDRGLLVTINGEGWAALLDWEQETDLVFPGPIALYEICRSLCTWRGVPSFVVDQITAPITNATIMLGGNPDYEDGQVIIPRRTSPLAWLRRTLGLFGYRIFDTPSGTVRVQRVSGLPAGTVAATYETGVNLYGLRRTRDVRTMATYITVKGPTYTDGDGIRVVPSSIPATVPESAYLLPPGYRAADISDNVLVTDDLAGIVRNVAEIDGGAPTVHQRWETRGDAWRQPGESVAVQSSHLGTAGVHWLMATDWRIDDGGYVTTMEGWAGGGTALAAGIDEVEIAVLTDPVHVGDEYVAWYAVPSAGGKSVTVQVTVPEIYTSLYFTAFIHGSNSQFIGGKNEDLTLSKIVVTQGGKEVGTADMPVVAENYASQLPYDPDVVVTFEDGSSLDPIGYYYWHAARGPIPGRYEAGTIDVTFASGENRSLPDSTKWDDWEIAEVTFHFSGVGTPTLPSGGA